MSNVVVIGAGQAGLAMSYSLQQLNVAHTVLESNQRIGDNWRKRWDSLALFSPVRYNSLPGWPFPGEPYAFPDKDTAAEYLENYAQKFHLPIRTGVQVKQVRRVQGYFEVETTSGEVLIASSVVIATGPFRYPHTPAFAADLPADLLQMHTKDYKNPSQMQPGNALVVGAGASGSQIALELSATRKVYIAGRDNGALPRTLLGKDIYWWLYTTGALRIRWNSWLGRRLLKRHQRGNALIGTSLKKIVAQGDLTHFPKVIGFEAGHFRLADGRKVPPVRNVIWATGYRPGYNWIDLPVFGQDGWPLHRRGVVTDAPGLYFLGLKTLYRFNSSSMGGVGEDAIYLAQTIAKNRAHHGKRAAN